MRPSLQPRPLVNWQRGIEEGETRVTPPTLGSTTTTRLFNGLGKRGGRTLLTLTAEKNHSSLRDGAVFPREPKRG